MTAQSSHPGSAIWGPGHGSAHNWGRGETPQVGSAPDGVRFTFYRCRDCRVSFVHRYNLVPDIFAAIEEAGVPDACPGPGPLALRPPAAVAAYPDFARRALRNYASSGDDADLRREGFQCLIDFFAGAAPSKPAADEQGVVPSADGTESLDALRCLASVCAFLGTSVSELAELRRDGRTARDLAVLVLARWPTPARG